MKCDRLGGSANLAVVVLAAGEGRRFGGPKQVVTLPSVLERVQAAGASDVVVVEGAHPLGALPLPSGVRLVRCELWEKGPGASLRAGLDALGPEVAAAVVVLADGPDLQSEAVHRIVASWEREGGDVVAASYAGVQSHPLLVARAAWDTIPPVGLRGRAVRLVACDDLGAPGDVDCPDDLPQRLRSVPNESD